MAKQAEDSKTGDMFEVKRGRGRPKKVGALTNAERQAAFRARRVSVDLGERMSATVRDLASEFDMDANEVMRELVRFALTNRNWKQTGFPTKD